MGHKTSNSKIDLLAITACHEAAVRMSGHNPALHFTERLLTKDEQIKVGRRLLIAEAILKGKTRMEICDKLEVSPNTYRQVRIWLYSEFKQYKPKQQKPAADKKRKQQYTDPFTYEGLKRRYPAHFLLFSVAEALFKK